MMKHLESRHRQRKRKAEVELAMRHLASCIDKPAGAKILEFGSGDGYQIPYLRKLGDLTVSDIYKSDSIAKNFPGLNFVICDIRKTPFESESFDLIFANHVLEHISGISKAFSEMRRVGKPGCVYAFTVPTAVWLILSLPAQFYNGVRKLFIRSAYRDTSLWGHFTSSTNLPEISKVSPYEVKCPRAWRKIMPRGHGWRKNFFECLNSFKIKNWRALFKDNGFKIIEMAPLLLYAPSEFPIIPTTRFLAKNGICSSIIFIMKKAA